MSSARRKGDGGRSERPKGPRLVALGLLIAIWSSMCGIGGGLFAVPALHYFQRFPLREAVATSLGLVAATTVSATLAELFLDESALHFGIAAALAAGSLLGAELGFRAARRIEMRPLKVVFSVLLLAVGLQLVLSGARAAAVDARSLELGAGDYGVCALIGVASGFVAPLLGIGGGLIAVPALLQGLPGLGYLGARACSLAMGAVSSVRSLGMYRGTGLIDTRRALFFAGGAVVGAAIGARLVYAPGVEHVARRMLGATLLWVALRFARDAWRGEAEPATNAGPGAGRDQA